MVCQVYYYPLLRRGKSAMNYLGYIHRTPVEENVTTVLTAARLLTPSTVIDQPTVVIEDGRILSIEQRTQAEHSRHTSHLDFPNATLIPALFDVHTHGAMGHDVMEGTESAFNTIGKFLAHHGVGAYLPTTVTAPVDRTLHALEGIATQIERAASTDENLGARPIGIHLEGPFLSHEKRGVHPPEDLQPLSLDLLRSFQEAARNHIVLMTVAPELPDAIPFIQEATRLGIRVSLGHTNATMQQAMAAIAAGAISATHTFNAMPALDHRNPGLLGVVLDDPELFAELICDGIHVDPLMVRLFHRMKRADRGILITDSMSATGMPDGIYKLGGFDVTLSDGVCLHKGNLAGSALTLDRAVRNFVQFTGATVAAAVRFASTNPANMAGVGNLYGELAPGRPANIVVLSADGKVQATLLNGQLIPAATSCN